MLATILAQTTDFWDRLLSQNNIQLLILVAIGLFLYLRGWPFIEKRIERNDARHEAETAQFLATLDKIVAAHAAEMKEQHATQQAQNMAITNLTQSIDTLIAVRKRGGQQ